MKNISKTKIKTHDNKINTNFHKNVVPEGCHCVFLLIILIDRVSAWMKVLSASILGRKNTL